MKLSLHIILYSVLLMCLQTAVSGQNIFFNHLGTDNGLSQFSVNCLYVDENGFIWIGTRDGLNWYDGNGVHTVLSEKNDSNSLLGNTILRMTGDGNGKIFILCTEGLCQYDLISRKFTTLLQGDFSCICYSKALYVSRKNEIFRFNESTGNFDLYYQLPGSNQEIGCLYISSSSMFIGTVSRGIYVLNLATDSISHPVERGNIISFYEDSGGDIWAGSWNDGLFRMFKDGSVKNYKHNSNEPFSISSDFVRTCCEDDNGTLWIGTFNGLNSFDYDSGKFVNHVAGDPGRQELSHSSIWCIVKDGQGTLWLGTYFGGVNFFNPEYEIYTRYYSSDDEESKGLSSPVVGRIIEGDGDDLWIATEGGGLNLFDRRTGKFKWFRHHSGQNSISHDNVKSLYYDKSNRTLWIGTHLGGLNKYDIPTGRFTVYRHQADNPQTLPSDIIRDIEPYKDKLIIATQAGVCLFNPADGECSQMFQDTREGREIVMAPDVFIDKDGHLWVAATGSGVFRYDFERDSLIKFSHNPDDSASLSNDNVNGIMQDSEGRVWLATVGGGIDLYQPETRSFLNFDRNSGLSSDCVYEMQESPSSGNLLLITNNSFSVFNPSEAEFHNYDSSNGFPLSALNENAIRVTGNGDVFLGGIEGMISFKERDLKSKPKPYHIVLTGLVVNGKEVNTGDDTGILKQALYLTPKLILKASQNMFTFEFAVTNYIPANKEEIVYRLEGFSKEWNSTRGDTKITYTNLNPGTYRLVIKAAGKYENICPSAEIEIKMLPPFYKTKAAFCFYLLAAVLIFLYVKRIYKTRIRLQESLRYEKQHLEDTEALTQSKLRFFTNISHEFRTPLTIIVAEVETLMQTQNFTPAIYNKVLAIYKNSVQLRELITELLDFRKQEQGHLKLKVSQHNIVDYLYENYLLFEGYAVTKRINFSFHKTYDDIEVWFDQKQMQKVVNNLLSNAVKHTSADGSITLSVGRDSDKAFFSVKDTGTGIDKAEVNQIFNRFYQVDGPDSMDSANAGTGIGLALTKGIVELHHGCISVESELGEGSEFIVELPLGRSMFSEDQINRNPDSVQQGEVSLRSEGIGAREAIPEASAAKHRQGMKMLVVEDNDQIRTMLAELFRPFYDVKTASDGEEGWNMVVSESPNIVVSDVVMPKMSGIELCKRIKADSDTCHIPVVLLTARTAVEQNIEGLLIGADDYINKPFNINLLIARCNNLVNSRILLQEKFSRQPQAFPQMLATNPLDKQLLDKAVDVINNHLDDSEFNVSAFAREMAMSRTNLFAKLKAVTGQTPNDFILTIRLKKGALMLRNNPELNVTDISDEIGFGSARYFSKCFKEIYHISPLAYRNGREAETETETE